MDKVFDSRRDRGDNTTYTRKQAIRAFCTECMGGQPGLVPGCPSPTCPLFYWRMAHDERPGRVKRTSSTAHLRRYRELQAASRGRSDPQVSPGGEEGKESPKPRRNLSGDD